MFSAWRAWHLAVVFTILGMGGGYIVANDPVFGLCAEMDGRITYNYTRGLRH